MAVMKVSPGAVRQPPCGVVHDVVVEAHPWHTHGQRASHGLYVRDFKGFFTSGTPL